MNGQNGDTVGHTASGDITGRSFIVTGGGSGIGAAVCARLSELGARVAVVDINLEAAERTVSSLSGDAVAITGDVTTVDGTDAYVAASVDAFGDIAGAHLNAGVLGTPMPLADTDPAAYDWEMAVNAKGVYLGLRAVIRRLRDQGSGGSVVATASTGGLSGSKNMGIYVASKHAVVGLVRCAALDYCAEGIRVNALCPGEVDTPMLQRAIEAFSADPGELEATRSRVASSVPFGRVADPAELAAAAAWLLSPLSSYVTGTTMVVDGGLSAGRFSAR